MSAPFTDEELAALAGEVKPPDLFPELTAQRAAEDAAEAKRYGVDVRHVQAARRHGMEPDEHELFHSARTAADIERGMAELERKRSARAEAQRQLDVEREKRSAT